MGTAIGAFTDKFESKYIFFIMHQLIFLFCGFIVTVGGTPALNETRREASERAQDAIVIKPARVFVYNYLPFSSWMDAGKECQKRGGDLAVLCNYKDFDLVYKIVSSPGTYVWIGGQRVGANYKEDNAWLSGEPIPYKHKYWCDSHRIKPKNRCIASLKNAEKRRDGTEGPCLGTVSCDVKRPFLCEMSNEA